MGLTGAKPTFGNGGTDTRGRGCLAAVWAAGVAVLLATAEVFFGVAWFAVTTTVVTRPSTASPSRNVNAPVFGFMPSIYTKEG